MPSEIAVPFSLNAAGEVAVITDPDEQIGQRVRALMSTTPGERVMLPTYGVPLDQLVFAIDEDFAEVEASELVSSAMAHWEPGVMVRSVAPIPDETELGVASVAVDYVRTEAPTSPSGLARSVNTAVIRIGGEVKEEVRG